MLLMRYMYLITGSQWYEIILYTYYLFSIQQAVLYSLGVAWRKHYYYFNILLYPPFLQNKGAASTQESAVKKALVKIIYIFIRDDSFNDYKHCYPRGLYRHI